MKCLMKAINLHHGDVVMIDGHKHTLVQQDNGGAVFMIGGGFATYGAEVEIEFGGWVERPSVDFMKEHYGIDITTWRESH